MNKNVKIEIGLLVLRTSDHRKTKTLVVMNVIHHRCWFIKMGEGVAKLFLAILILHSKILLAGNRW